jgi:hypothetical protein
MSDNDNVIRFPKGGPDITHEIIPPEVILTAALDKVEMFETLFLVGWKKDGGLFMASTDAYIPDIISTLEIAKMEHIHMMVGDRD